MTTFTIRFFNTDQTIVEYNIESSYMETAIQTAIRKYNDNYTWTLKPKKIEAFPKKA